MKGPAMNRCSLRDTKPNTVIAKPGRLLLGAACWLGIGLAHALPEGGAVSAGSGSIGQSGNTLTVSQNSPRLAINWLSFNVGGGETVRFLQPSAGAIALNRVLGSDGSRILGRIEANGQVFLLNPNGVLFGRGAEVNVGGLVASTLNLSDADFMAGKTAFSGKGGSVTNQGALTAAEGGYVALLGGQVANEGVIAARLGIVALAAGDKVTLDFAGNRLLNVTIDEATLQGLVANRNLIRADGGLVLLTTQARDAVMAGVVNNSGVIEARTVENRAGVIRLLGDMAAGTVQVGGTLDASAPNGGDGGFVETSAAKVSLHDTARITTLAAGGRTGTWLLDPTDFTVAAGGGDITGATLSTQLGLGNVTVATSAAGAGNGDLFVNDTVAWGANTLTLSAHRNIAINAPMNGTGTAGLALWYGQGAPAAGNTATYIVRAPVNLPAAGQFSTRQGSDGATLNYTIITSLGAAGSTTGTDLQGIDGNLAGNYALGADIDASPTSTWNPSPFVPAGFLPIGTGSSFTGRFAGLGHTIGGLFISRPAASNVGLFSVVGTQGAIQDVGLTGGSLSGLDYVGGLVGTNWGTLFHTYASGSVLGLNNLVGGLVGYNQLGSDVLASFSAGHVTGNSFVGGLVGGNESAASVQQSYSTAAVHGDSSGDATGGLVGGNVGVIYNSYATGSVVGGRYVGGLIGINYHTIDYAYATGSVGGSTYVGGLVGHNYDSPSDVRHSYWNVTTTGQSTSSGNGTGVTGAQMLQMGTFAGWSIADSGGAGGVWRIYEGQTAPLLNVFLRPLTVSAASGSRTYDGSTASLGVSYSMTPDANLLGTAAVAGVTSKNVGSYALTPSGHYSNQQGYDISYANGTLTVTPRTLNVTYTGTNKVYDGTVAAGVTTADDRVGGDDLAINRSAAFADRNAGIGKAVSISGVSLGGADAANYSVAASGAATADIAPAALTVRANDALKSFDSLPYSGGNGVSTLGLAGGDTAAGVLAGTLSYGGSSQGATTLGSYAITPGGLSPANGNYTLAYADGTLRIVPPSAPPPLTAARNTAGKPVVAPPQTEEGQALPQNALNLTIVEPGLRLPQ
jgi:filamentous hemagglutinin family protein